jgi:2-dehydro-3-deoxygluconokinase
MPSGPHRRPGLGEAVNTGHAPPSVLTFGEALVGYATEEPTLRSATRFTRFLGGAELNVAVGLTRLGVAATWASVVGEDAHGDYIIDTVESLGITSLVDRAPGPTALMFKAGGDNTDPEVLQIRHDSAFSRHANVVLKDLQRLRAYRHLHLTGIPLGTSSTARDTTLALLESATSAGLTTSFDPNLRLHLFPDQNAMRATLNAVAAACTVVLPGMHEGRLLTGESHPAEIAEFYLRAGVQEVVIKLGPSGAFARSATQTARSRIITVQPVDTVGAGDGFAAGYLAAFLTGSTLQERVDQAAAVGALVATRRGDLDAMPTQDDLRAFRSAEAAQADVPSV